MMLDSLQPGKVIMLVGARRVGKTMLINGIAEMFAKEVLLLNGEDLSTASLLENRNIEYYRRLIGGKTLLIIDEAQKIPDIGAIAKLMVDHLPLLRIILTGSSAFDLHQGASEPLTGRKITLQMHPLAVQEFSAVENMIESAGRLGDHLIFGCYPEVWQYPDKTQKIVYLKELATDYLLKDIMHYDGIRNASRMQNLLRLVALQSGREVSYDELGRQLGLNKNTVEKYLDLLTKVFVLIKVGGYSRNLRKEVSKSSKWYFADTGIRNVFAANFNELSQRNDIGALWENYCVSERFKFISHQNMHTYFYFWRTYDQQEIDWVEERDGRLFAYEFKWAPGRYKPPIAWIRAYPDASFEIVHRDNYYDWLSIQASA